MAYLRWVTINSCPFYEINWFGEIRSKKTGRILKQRMDKRGRLTIQLMGKNFTVSRLVAEAFIGDIPEGMDVMHLDGNKTNNRCDNLEICTRKETIRHGIKIGTIKPNDFGKERIRVRVIETGKEYDSINECARDIKCNSREISNYLLGYKYPVRGYTFERI